MKKVMSILAIALFSVGVISYNEYKAVDKADIQFQNIDNAVATDGSVSPTDKRT